MSNKRKSEMGVSKKKRSVLWFIFITALVLLLLWTTLFGLKIDTFSIPNVLDGGIRQGLDLRGGSVIVYEAQVDGTPSDDEMSTVVTMLQKRLDDLAYSEATVARQGDRRVRVEIPDVANPEDAVQELGQTAKLSFVDYEGNELLGSTQIKKASPDVQSVDGTTSEPVVVLEFTEEGRAAFKEATATVSVYPSPDNYLAIMMDDTIISQPRVEKEIDGDSAIIYGSFTAAETKSLANLISAGRLPFALKAVELSAIGPTLGEKALSTSLQAGAIGILIVLLFMILVYRIPGLIADLTLLAYIGITLAAMAILKINLSLPGIAGLILSIGMALDANVIIFERFNEEIALGKSVSSAVNVGFARAFSAIFDGNITTLIAAIVLWWKGTGPIQGFAITLGLGVVISMFTAITLTRLLLKLLVGMNIKNPKLFSTKHNLGGAQHV